MEEIHSYYIHYHGIYPGPYTLHSLVECLNQQKANPKIKVFIPGWSKWKLLAQLPTLQELCAKTRLYPKANFQKISEDWLGHIQETLRYPQYMGFAARRLSTWDIADTYLPSPHIPKSLKEKILWSILWIGLGILTLLLINLYN